MIATLSFLCCLLIAANVDNVAWHYDATPRIIDTQLITLTDQTLLAVLQADHTLRLLDANTGQTAGETTTEFSLLGFAEQIPTSEQPHPQPLTLTTLAGCQPFTLTHAGVTWRLEAEPFIPVIDPELPKADPEFNDRLLAAWQAGATLLTLTTRGRLEQFDLINKKTIKTRQLPAIGALRHATAINQLAISYKHRTTVTLSVLNASDIDQTLSMTLPEATIPRRLTLSAAAAVAHYTDRAYVLPLSPAIRRFIPMWLIEDWPLPVQEKPALPAEFKRATQQHLLPDAIILVADEWIVRLSQP